MLNEAQLIDTTFDPCEISLDYTFKSRGRQSHLLFSDHSKTLSRIGFLVAHARFFLRSFNIL